VHVSRHPLEASTDHVTARSLSCRPVHIVKTQLNPFYLNVPKIATQIQEFNAVQASFFTAQRNAIRLLPWYMLSAYVRPSVRPSVRHTSVLYQNG